MKFTTLIILLVLSACVIEVECKFRVRSKPRIRSRTTRINRMNQLKRLQKFCKENTGNSTSFNDYYCRMCVENIEYCDYRYLPSITLDYCSELATNTSYAEIPYYCTVCLANTYTCISPKSVEFKRFETIKFFNNCSNYPMDAEECVQYCKVDNLLPKSEISNCSKSSTTYELMAIGFNLLIALRSLQGNSDYVSHCILKTTNLIS